MIKKIINKILYTLITTIIINIDLIILMLCYYTLLDRRKDSLMDVMTFITFIYVRGLFYIVKKDRKWE